MLLCKVTGGGFFLLLMWHTLALASPIIITDGTFSDSDWTFLSFTCTSSSSNSSQSSGGSPGDFRAVSNHINAGGGGSYSNAATVGLKLGTIDPAAIGGLATVQLDADVRCRPEDGCFGQGVAVGIGMRQSGLVYISTIGITGLGDWNPVSSIDRMEMDFFLFDEASCPGDLGVYSVHPDFSPQGDPIEFGFVIWNSGSGEYALIAGIDNWTLTIEPANPSSVEEGFPKLHGLRLAKNPAQHRATLQFSLEKESFTNVSIYDVLGRHVQTLRSELLAQGEHQFKWDGTNAQGMQAVPGAYFFRISSASGSASIRFIMTR